MVDVNVCVEFGYEIAVAVPYAYWHHVNGSLLSTVSCHDTSVFYPFSANHREMYPDRNDTPVNDIFTNHHNIEAAKFTDEMWLPPPLKDTYANNLIVSEKPIMTIANKYCVEWGSPPRNFINPEALDILFSTFKDKYQIIYSRYCGEGSDDLSWKEKIEFAPLNDWAIVDKHPEVITIQELHRKFPQLTFNRLQVMLYANTDAFISVSGGTTIFVCYFAKDTVMFVKNCRDVGNGAIKGWYKQLYGTEVHDVSTDEDLINKSKELYL